MPNPRVAAIVTGSDTVSTAIDAVASLARTLPDYCEIVVVYSCAPECVTKRVHAAAAGRPVTVLADPEWHTQNVGRNRAYEAFPGFDYYLLLDMDSRLEPGGFEQCLKTHEETGADLVGGVILYAPSVDFGREGERLVHYAGGRCWFRPDADGRPGMEQVHEWVNVRYEDMIEKAGAKPWDSEQLEYHGMCLTARAAKALFPTDTNFLAMENCDLAQKAKALGLKSVVDPLFVITYVNAAQHLCDIEPYRRHWGSQAVDDSVLYFARKYGLAEDGEFVAWQTGWNRAHYEDIGAVPRREFPAPPLTDLFDHPFAQTWPQLLHQLQTQGWTVQEIEPVKRCHDVGLRLANGRYRACGKPFLTHLIGVASVLAAYGAPPVMVRAGLVHAAYGELGLRLDDDDTADMVAAFTQAVGRNVDRLLQAFSGDQLEDHPLPESDEDWAFYPVSAARSLIMLVANEIDEFLDGADALMVKRRNTPVLRAHAKAVLPRIGFDALLQAFEAALRLNAVIEPPPEPLLDNRQQSYRLLDGSAADSVALPDGKWVEVSEFLRASGRAADVTVAPDEFRFLCGSVRHAILAPDPWNGMAKKAILVLHKGRLHEHPSGALPKVAETIPIFANEVFAVYSRVGDAISRDRLRHIAGVTQAAGVS
jgi:GT2 family glycosyltransferase